MSAVSSKYGPFKQSPDGVWRSAVDGSPEFEAESALKRWLISNVATAHNKHGEQVIRQPGTLAGVDFSVINCRETDIILLDHTSQVIIEECENCSIFIGPCSGSVFIRDCKNCDLMIVTRQLRTRDCKNLKLWLYCNTAPCIEASRKLQFSCFAGGYPELKEQMQKCQLSVCQNRWYNINDFDREPQAQSWKVMENGAPTIFCNVPRGDRSFWSQESKERSEAGALCNPTAEVIPITCPGITSQQLAGKTASVLLFTPQHTADALRISKLISRKEDTVLIDAKHMKMAKESWAQFPGSSKFAGFGKCCLNGAPCVSLKFAGDVKSFMEFPVPDWAHWDPSEAALAWFDSWEYKVMKSTSANSAMASPQPACKSCSIM